MPPSQIYRRATDFPADAPVFPLSGALLLPRGALPLNIFEPRYLNMIDDALSGDRLIGMIQPVTDAIGSPATGSGTGPDARNGPPLRKVGCLGRLTSFSETPDGRYLITLTGVCRFDVISELDTPTPYRRVRLDTSNHIADLAPGPDDDPAFNREAFVDVLHAYFDAMSLEAEWESIQSAPLETLTNALAMICPFEPDEKQALLEAESVTDRLAALTTLMHLAVAGSPTSRLQ